MALEDWTSSAYMTGFCLPPLHALYAMVLDHRKPVFRVQVDTNWAAELQNMVRGLKFRI